MATVICSQAAGSGLTLEEMAMLEEAERLPQVYDDDCPRLSPEELAEFHPVHFATWEERNRAMREEMGLAAGAAWTTR